MIVLGGLDRETLIGRTAGSSGSGFVRAFDTVRGWPLEPSTWVRPVGRRQEDEPRFDDRSRTIAARPPLTAGDELGDYRLLEPLGHGAQGDVWKAIRRGPTLELAALKVLKPSLARDPARMAQFRREAERGGRFDGPSLLPVFELGSTNGYHYMAMPYVEGVSLREIIRARAAHVAGRPVEELHRLVTLDEPDYFRTMGRLLLKAVEAMARVHAHRVAHRDIKPANILIDHGRPETVYFCDFGLGRDLEIATPEQMRDGAGTPMYMAPERLLRATADEIRCDIYSMGVTIFEALTLVRPFRVPDYVSLPALPAYLAGAVARRPSEVRRGFPPDLEATILRAMNRLPARRQESADQLAAELRQALDRWAHTRTRPVLDDPHPIAGQRPHSIRLARRA